MFIFYISAAIWGYHTTIVYFVVLVSLVAINVRDLPCWDFESVYYLLDNRMSIIFILVKVYSFVNFSDFD